MAFVMLGGAMIIAAITLVSWRESRRKRRGAPAAHASDA